ncbi:MAG: hypothetical protein L3J73_04655 [Thermoplasmata archaeon]|nr:hypothetical protein [Thermoplasmata archaeon]
MSSSGWSEMGAPSYLGVSVAFEEAEVFPRSAVAAVCGHDGPDPGERSLVTAA